MNDKSTFWMALFSIVLSTFTVILFFIKVDENSVVNSDTFTSACTAIITVGVTLAVGFQVFQSLDIKSKVNIIEYLNAELNKARKEYELLNADLKSTMLYNESDRKFNEGDIFNAILKLQEAIDVYLRSNLNKKDIIPSWMELLKIYVSAITKREKHENKDVDKLLVNNFNLLWRHNTISLKQNPNFWAIEKNYNAIQEELKESNYEL